MKTIQVMKADNLLELLNSVAEEGKTYSIKTINTTYEDEEYTEGDKPRNYITVYDNIEHIRISDWTFGTDYYVTTSDNVKRKLWETNVNSSDETLERIGNKYLSESVRIISQDYIVLYHDLEKWLKQFNLDYSSIIENKEIKGYFNDKVRLTEEELDYMKTLLEKDSEVNQHLLTKIKMCYNNLCYKF